MDSWDWWNLWYDLLYSFVILMASLKKSDSSWLDMDGYLRNLTDADLMDFSLPSWLEI